MILDRTFFTRKELFIQGTVAQPAAGFNTPSGSASLDSEIAMREKEVLVYALGIAQYNELSGYFTGNDLNSGAPQKWVDLVEGKQYGNKVWQGLRYEIGSDKYSFIAYYVYYRHLMENYSFNTNLGVAVPESANASVKPPIESLVSAWNSFIHTYGVSGHCCIDDFLIWDWTECGCNGATHVTLGQFLRDFPDDYDSGFFRNWNHGEPINSWGI